jgi:predicted alpha/beta hydrolase family esterase
MKLAQKIAIGYIRARLNMMAVISPAKAAEQAFRLFGTPQYKSGKSAPEIFKTSERLVFKLCGKKVTGFRWNHPQPRKLLILHGFESSCYNFDHFISLAIKQGYEVLAFDAPAHGQSEGKTISLPDYVEMIRKIVELYGPVIAFIGHSFGGLAIAHYLETVKHDHQTKSVLIAPATETTTALDSFFRFLQLNDRVRKEFEVLIHKRSGVWPEHFSIRRAMKHIRASILWVHDEDDLVTPISDVLKVKELGYPNIEFMFTKGLGHRKIYRDTEVKKKVFSFL